MPNFSRDFLLLNSLWNFLQKPSSSAGGWHLKQKHLSKKIRGRAWGSHFTSVKLLVETSETCTQKKINTTQHKRSKQKKNFRTRSDHNKDCEDLCKNRKIDETQKQSWRNQGPTTTLLASRCVENGIYWRATMLPHQIFVSSDGHGNWYTIGRISASDPILPYLISDSDMSVIPHESNGRFYVKLLSRRSSQPWFLLFFLYFLAAAVMIFPSIFAV